MEMKAPETIPYFLQEQVRQMIIDGTLRPGQPLREQELERRFGTSRSPIREALRLLELSGLVTHMQRRGFRVALYSEREVRDLYLLRAELEAYSISQLAECESVAPLVAELEEFHATMTRSDAQGAALDYLTQVREFFGAIVRYNQNNPLSATLTKLNERCEPLRHTLLRRGLTKAEVSTSYAGEILDAVKQGDFARAACTRRRYVRSHLPMVLQAYAEAAYSESSAAS